MDKEDVILLLAVMMILVVGIAMFFFPPSTDEPAPAPTTDAILTELLDAVDFDWGMCFGDCCITAEAFEEFTRKQCEGGE